MSKKLVEVLESLFEKENFKENSEKFLSSKIDRSEDKSGLIAAVDMMGEVIQNYATQTGNLPVSPVNSVNLMTYILNKTFSTIITTEPVEDTDQLKLLSSGAFYEWLLSDPAHLSIAITTFCSLNLSMESIVPVEDCESIKLPLQFTSLMIDLTTTLSFCIEELFELIDKYVDDSEIELKIMRTKDKDVPLGNLVKEILDVFTKSIMLTSTNDIEWYQAKMETDELENVENLDTLGDLYTSEGLADGVTVLDNIMGLFHTTTVDFYTRQSVEVTKVLEGAKLIDEVGQCDCEDCAYLQTILDSTNSIPLYQVYGSADEVFTDIFDGIINFLNTRTGTELNFIKN